MPPIVIERAIGATPFLHADDFGKVLYCRRARATLLHDDGAF